MFLPLMYLSLATGLFIDWYKLYGSLLLKTLRLSVMFLVR